MTSIPHPQPENTETVTAENLRASVQSIYRELAREIETAGPVCDLSGRCCRFAEWDHTLFLSGIEAEILIQDAPPPVRMLDNGETCPWQNDRGHCTAREARPLGCRVYYCDPAYQGKAEALSEVYLGQLKRLTEELGRPWSYAPLHRHLHSAKNQGSWRSFSPPDSLLVAPDPLTLL